MKLLLTTLLTLAISATFAQRSEDLIPKDAISVFSINNVNLLQKISLDELVKYEFMEEVQQELFDGSTSGKSLKDSGIDFDQKWNVFTGKNDNYDVTGLTFGISNREKLFEAFDDFQPSESIVDGVDFYSSYFNRVAIKENSGILFRINPKWGIVEEITDSIWYARGNQSPWYHGYPDFDVYDEFEIDIYEDNAPPEGWNEHEEEGVYNYDEKEFDNMESEVPEGKTYYELRDSVELAIQMEYTQAFCEDLFIHGNTLIKNAPKFKQSLEESTEGTFYMDNSRNIMKQNDMNRLRYLYPSLHSKLEGIYEGNILIGNLSINDNSIDMQLNTEYGDQIGEVYERLTDSKFDKNVLNYIHKDNSAFFTYNINLREAYEETHDIFLPILSESDNYMMNSAALAWDLLDEFVNKDALFDMYRGSFFGTYSGIQKIKTKKIIFDYDEETFEYIEQEVDAEEDMPIFAFGFSTGRNDLIEKILKHQAKIYNRFRHYEMEEGEDRIRNEGNYWVIENGLFNSVPVYLINKNDLFIYTNDEDLAKYHSGGLGGNAISKKAVKKAMKGGAVYAYADLGKAIENLPQEIFDDKENELIDVLRGKSGTVELTSAKASKNKSSVNLSYEFEGEYENSGTYILDLINSLYVISK